MPKEEEISLASISIHAWINENNIVNEKGDPIEFREHLFLFDIYSDESKNLVVMKPAQVGLSTLQVFKTIWDSYRRKIDSIYCVDEETEILTKRGFLKQEELLDDDTILTLDTEGVSMWTKLEEIFRKEYSGEMINFEARNFSACVTPGHRWLVRQYYVPKTKKQEYFFVKTDDFGKKNLFIPKRLLNPLVCSEYNDDFIKLLSWVFSEGYYCKIKHKHDWSIIITQSFKKNKKYCNEIENIFKKLKLVYKRMVNYRGDCYEYRFAFEMGKFIKESFPEKIPTPEFISSLSTRQAKIFIDEFVKGDGWTDRTNTKAIIQKSKKCIDVLCMAAAIAGYSPSIVKPSKNGCWTLRLTQFEHIYTSGLKSIKKQYKGIVWCPRTKYGTFYARRMGRCYWTGNTLPTYNDVNVFVSGKVNRLIKNNPILLELTKDKDTIEQKQIGDSMIYYRGTFNERAAIMIPADVIIHDELDSSDQKNASFYVSRMQHSKIKEMRVFSHPSVEGFGVSHYYNKSDKKEWFIKCPHCKEGQFLKWPDNVDKVRKIFICQFCKGELGRNDRRVGEWKPTAKGKKWSGYHISLLMCPWVTAKEIIEKSEDEQTGVQFFYNKVLGLPYTGSECLITSEDIYQNIQTQGTNLQEEPVVIGVDTGLALSYVIGNQRGIFHYGECAKYEDLEAFLTRWKRSVMVIDAGGDIVGSRALREKYPGRVFLCYFAKDRKTYQLLRWGKNDDEGAVVADRNRIIQLVVDEFKDKRLALWGTREEYANLVKHFLNIYRVEEENKIGIKEFKWKRKGRDDWCLDGNSIILTKNGNKKLKDVTEGEYVLTRKGWNKVLKSGITRRNTEVLEVLFSNGSKLIATPNHKVWVVGKEWTRLDTLDYNDIILAIKPNKCKSKQLCSTELNLEGIQSQNTGRIDATSLQEETIGKEELDTYTKKFIDIILEKFLKGIVSTIRTKIRLIIRWITLKYKRGEHTNHFIIENGCRFQKIRKKCLNILEKYINFHKPTLGKKQKKEKNKCEETQLRHFLYRLKNLFVLNVKMNQKREEIMAVNSAQENVLQGGHQEKEEKKKRTLYGKFVSFVETNSLLINILKSKPAPYYVRVKRLVKLKKKRDVYNLSVENCHEYFANGILVSNCLSTCYFRIGMSRYGSGGSIVGGDSSGIVMEGIKEGIRMNHSECSSFDTSKLIMPDPNQDDWRNF